MRRRRARGGPAWVALAAFFCAGAAPPHSWDRVTSRLAAAGGARVSAVQVATSPADGARDSVRMKIVLGVPCFLRMEHAGRSRVVVMRPDGGEILDPRHRQLIRLGPEQARRVAGVWQLFLSPGSGLREKPLSSGRSVALLPGGDAAPESVWITLGRDSLPARLELGPGRMVRLDLSGWQFTRPTSPASFRLAAPAGYEVVDWP